VDLDGLIGRLEASLRAVGSAERAASEQRYLKSDLRFIGVRLSDIREAVKYLPAETAARLIAAYREKGAAG
jgi:hypothetical protein